ncbi:MAG: DNA ligase D [Thermoleophilia bacterium]
MSDPTPPLEAYRGRRDFARTPEPDGGDPMDSDGRPRFVVQRHDARALHFDLRLEHDGVLWSWAVPKGVPLRGGVKRLAVRTEDHPLEYLTFADVIPDGEYGAGRMTIWDEGTYRPLLMGDSEIKLVFEGRRCTGEYHLVRTGDRQGKAQWLLFRASAAGPGAEDPTPRFLDMRPMLARPADAPPVGPDVVAELKWDGYRTLALITGDGVELRSRTGKALTDGYPELSGLRRGVFAQETLIDGEICVLDADGRADFQGLQRHERPVTLMAFDLLYQDGEWLLDEPLEVRRERLAQVVTPEAAPRLVVSEQFTDAPGLFAAAAARGIEGIVAKRLGGAYRPGERSRDWVKVKTREEATLLIGGWTAGEGSRRSTIGALLVGRPEDDGLRCLGLVGSGLRDATAAALRADLDTRTRPDSPFVSVPEDIGAVTFTEPRQWCRVAYSELTGDGRMRAPVFLGLADGPDEGDTGGGTAVSGDGGSDTQVIASGGRQVRLTNRDKLYWPDEGITKGQLLDHYLRVSEWLVPHLAGRPMILKRYPNGIEGQHFFQHNAPEGAPEWLPLVTLGRGAASTETNRYLIVNDALALLWVVNLGCIDLNPWQSRADLPDQPTHVLFDLDPPTGMPFRHVVDTALLLREVLADLGLRGYPKTSGGRGIHVYVPVPPGLTYEVTRLFAQVVAEELVRRRPALLTTTVTVADRGGRLYLDANQNGRGRSIASVYSVRPRPGAPVSTPLEWDELVPDMRPEQFTMAIVARRLVERGDLFAGALDDPQPLADAIGRLAG